MHILTVGDAARMTGVCEATIRNWVKTGKLAAMRTARGQRLFLQADVERVVQERAK